MDNNISAEPKTVLKDKYRAYSIIGGILFLLYALVYCIQVFPIWQYGIEAFNKSQYYGFWSILSMLHVASNVLLSVGLLLGKKNTFLIVSSVLYALSMVSFPLLGGSISIGDLLYYLSGITLSVIVILSCTGNKKLKGILRKIFFIPAVIYLISYGVAGIRFIQYDLTNILTNFPAMLFAALWVVNDPVYVTVDPDNPEAVEGEGYVGLVMHVLLLLFTGGIWLYIWIYRTTAYLNRCKTMEQRSPAKKLLLCMFIPFYFIYWIYVSAQRIDILAREKGMNDSSASLCLILAIFIPIVPVILMQSKINSVISAPAGFNQPAYQPSLLGIADELKKFKELLDSGVITEEEFEAKKKQLLGQ